jgi:hypothetical protein
MTQDALYDVFLSHSHADAAWVERLAASATVRAMIRMSIC